MAIFEYEVRIRQGSCPAHGQVAAAKRVPKIKFPFFVTGAARGAAAVRPFRCP